MSNKKTAKRRKKPALVGNTLLPAVREKLKSFHIETLQDGSFNFFTQAENHKKALRRLQTDSSDYKRIARKDRDMTIIIKEIK